MSKKVMIVDDNEGVRVTVEIICQSAGIDLTVAEDGTHCLARLEEGFKGVILMDIMMPGLDGWDTIREIVARGFYDGNIIVMLTGKGEPDEKMDGLQEYVTDYMTKPFGQSTLIAALNYYTSLLKEADAEVAA
ncbi:response regulator [Geomonas sp. RF6]|uniref:response regulator n=1 Tax=Geomonas sp. RF6 TaxID=2897342 RepID=UPI001E4B0FD1|nr:response regulator [Geomonas sp. RF6]UFS69888.1 response regulator [Geomonas sp. RF6]